MISVVVPFYNESRSIAELFQRTISTFESCGVADFEIVVVENGSNDLERQMLASLATDPRIRVLVLSRNFGYQGALWAGLDHARGSEVIFMDADGEDPPELIATFLAKHREGYDVVYGIRQSRKVSWFMNACYRAFYRILAKLSHIPIPLDAGEFSLVGGQALVAMKQFKDRVRMMRILRAWIGFRQIGIPYHREARIAGKSKFKFLSAVAFAWDGIVAATDLPVKLSIYCSILCFFLGLSGTVYYLAWYFLASTKIPGFASLNITILLLFSMLFMCVSVLSRYVITLLDETRQRAPYLVSHEVQSQTSPAFNSKRDHAA